jgi:hypothetical protein
MNAIMEELKADRVFSGEATVAIKEGKIERETQPAPQAAPR